MWPSNHSFQARSTLDSLTGREGIEKNKKQKNKKQEWFLSALQALLFSKLYLDS